MREIKISIPFSSEDDSQRPTGLNLSSVNGYLVYPSIINNELVTEINVRDFLEEDKNSGLTVDFFNYLKTSTDEKEFNNIAYDNRKLADTLNRFYNVSVRDGQEPGMVIIEENLTGTTQFSEKNNNFNSRNNRRIGTEKSVLSSVNTGTSFYVDVYVESSQQTMAPITFNELVHDSIENNIFYTQGFVDINNPNNPFVNLEQFTGTTQDRIDKAIEDAKKEQEEQDKKDAAVDAGEGRG